MRKRRQKRTGFRYFESQAILLVELPIREESVFVLGKRSPYPVEEIHLDRPDFLYFLGPPIRAVEQILNLFVAKPIGGIITHEMGRDRQHKDIDPPVGLFIPAVFFLRDFRNYKPNQFTDQAGRNFCGQYLKFMLIKRLSTMSFLFTKKFTTYS